jgi:hypothetical protein
MQVRAIGYINVDFLKELYYIVHALDLYIHPLWWLALSPQDAPLK